MNVTVRLFASYRDAVGSALIEIPLEEGAGGEALWAALVARYPRLASLPVPAGFAVNDEYVPDPRPFLESDTIALIPPVSGGERRCQRQPQQRNRHGQRRPQPQGAGG